MATSSRRSASSPGAGGSTRGAYSRKRLAAAAIALARSCAFALELHGYSRDAAGFSSCGGGQASFQLPGSDFKARLVNECERYLEMTQSDRNGG